jgi:DNA-binding NarL/FixJ family response regulator
MGLQEFLSIFAVEEDKILETRNRRTGTDEMKILIADDHWIVRETLKHVMRQVSRKFEPLEAADFAEAQAILEVEPDIGLMLIDLIMPGFNEFEGLEKLRVRYPEVPVVVVSVHEDAEYVLKSIAHGVVGYIPKSAKPEEITQALTRVLSGEVSFPRRIIEGGRGLNTMARETASPAADQANEGIEDLSRRERDVLETLGQGLSITGSASRLKISPQTVRVHLGNAMKKLRLNDRSEAIHFAITHFGTK